MAFGFTIQLCWSALKKCLSFVFPVETGMNNLMHAFDYPLDYPDKNTRKKQACASHTKLQIIMVQYFARQFSFLLSASCQYGRERLNHDDDDHDKIDDQDND